jgi:Resolvase, N terminal domain
VLAECLAYLREGDTLVVTRADRIARSAADLLTTPSISAEVWLSFVRGAYDVAVMLPMKRVEIAVREAAGYGPGEIGVALMRRAFDLDNGPPYRATAARRGSFSWSKTN